MNEGDRASIGLGAGLAVGAGIGTALFAATDSPVWIGIGAGIGLVFGAALTARANRGNGGDDERR